MTLFVVPLVEVAQVGATREMVTVGVLAWDVPASMSMRAKDPSGNMDFHATHILSVSFDDVKHTMTIVGKGTNNGVPVNFTAVGVDNGSTALDRFSPLT